MARPRHPYPKVILHWRDPHYLFDAPLDKVMALPFTRPCVVGPWLVRECPEGVVIANEYDPDDPTQLRGVWFVPRENVVEIERDRRAKKPAEAQP